MNAAPAVEVHDAAFARCVSPQARVVQVASGCEWTEGPVYLGDRGVLVWSDIPGDRMLAWDERSGEVSVFRQPSRYSNGNTLDRQGRLVTCEHGERRVTRTEHDGSLTVLADRHDGRPLNSPNDVVVRSDGTVWFTDPTYGIDSDREGHQADQEQDGCFVFRVGPDGGAPVVVDDSFVRPNGLAFSTDERRLYVSDTGATHVAGGPRHLRVFEVGSDGTLSGGEVLVTCEAGLFDGFRVDEDDRIWTSAGDGVHCYTPDGRLLGKILLPEVVANVTFGGSDGRRLFICSTTTVHAVDLFVRGAEAPSVR